MAERLAVFGSGGHAKVVIEAVRARTPDREIVILDDRGAVDGGQLLGLSVSGGREMLAGMAGVPVALAIGNNQSRTQLMAWLAEQGHALERVIHPTAVIGATAGVGPGVFVAAGAIIIADAQIGAGAIINTGASVDHDCYVGEAAHIAPGVHLCGNVRVGARTLVGVGSSVRPGVSIAADVVLGAGAVVVGDIESAGTYVGNPAKPI